MTKSTADVSATFISFWWQDNVCGTVSKQHTGSVQRRRGAPHMLRGTQMCFYLGNNGAQWHRGSRHFRPSYTNAEPRFRIHCCSGVSHIIGGNKKIDYHSRAEGRICARRLVTNEGDLLQPVFRYQGVSCAACETIFMALFLFASFIWITLRVLSWPALTNKQWIVSSDEVETCPGYSSPLVHWRLTADTCGTAGNSFREGWLIIIYNILHFDLCCFTQNALISNI